MKKIFTKIFFLLMLFASFTSVAQVKKITGKITSSDDGLGLPGVTVKVKGTNVGETTKTDGTYAIQASVNQTITFSYIGYQQAELVVGSSNVINLSLKPDSKSLRDVVVTAFGIKQEKKTLGYSVQELSGDDLTRSKQPNIVNAMQGKVAGVFIQSSGGAPGAGASIIVRGITSLNPSANNQPLFVVDGIPISNETTTSNVLPSAGSNSPTSQEQFSFTNRAADINPDDIESLSVLKGPAATALYGLRAAGYS